MKRKQLIVLSIVLNSMDERGNYFGHIQQSKRRWIVELTASNRIDETSDDCKMLNWMAFYKQINAYRVKQISLIDQLQ